MGYRGKVAERLRARALRLEGWTVPAIAAELGVSRGSVSSWVRDLPFVGFRRGRASPSSLQVAREAEVEALLAEGRERIGSLSEREVLIAGAALYAGEGFKRDGKVGFANTDPRMIVLFLHWLRTCFAVEEARLRIRLYLHDDLDLDAAMAFWSELTAIPTTQFQRPYRAVAAPTSRGNRHPMGCPSVIYHDARTHRAIMGVVHALLPSTGHSFRGSSIGRASDC